MWETRLQPMAFSTELGCFTKHRSALERRTEKMIWIVFISIIRAGNGLTAGLLVFCTVH
jgi:uracil phosphoribosyltransferase